MRHIFTKNPVSSTLILVLSIFAASCSMIYDDDLRPCRNDVKIRFVYDLNMDFRDAFSKYVRSVEVWAFRRDGSLAWHGSRQGESLAEADFFLPANVIPGEYDFVSWCGLHGNDGYRLNTYQPATKEELYMMLATLPEGDEHVCNTPLFPVFNGRLDSVTVKSASTSDIEQEITISLVEDTKNISVSLSVEEPGNPDDFSVFITADNRRLDYDNMPSGQVTYRHWMKNPVKTRSAIVSYKIVTSRLMAGSGARLTVVRNNDGRRVIDIRLVDYLLKIKDNYPVKMGDQEFLDRENDYSLEFTLDNKWFFDFNSLIYINGWAIVPPQVENP